MANSGGSSGIGFCATLCRAVVTPAVCDSISKTCCNPSGGVRRASN